MPKTQIGLIGGGMVANIHAKALGVDPRAEIRWVADLSEQARKATGEAFNVPHLTADYRQMLADPELDAVIVCTPPKSHVKIALDVLEAGKHLLVEKPLAASLEEARELVAVAERYPKIKISACSARHARLNAKFLVVKKLIDDGKLGRVYYVHHRSVSRQGRAGVEYNPTAKWFLDRNLAGGGPMYDWGVYDLSFHLGVLGEPQFEKVEAFCVNGLDSVEFGTKVFTVEEHGAAFMQFEGGLRYYWERASNAHGLAPNQTVIYGTKGGLTLSYCTWNSPEVEFFYVDNDGSGKPQKEVIAVEKSQKNDNEALSAAWLDYLSDVGPVPMPLKTELKNLEIIHQVYAAAKW